MIVLSLIGVVMHNNIPVKFVTRDNLGKVGMHSAVELLSTSNVRLSNFSVRKDGTRIAVKCVNCKLSDLPVYNLNGSLISKPKVTILYALVNSDSRFGFCVMYANGVVERKRYIDVVELIRVNGCTNAYLKRQGTCYAVYPKYASFKERAI